MSGSEPVGRRARVAIHDASRGFLLPKQFTNAIPLVVWRCEHCKGRVLRLYASPDGWYLHGENYRVPLDQWFAKTSVDPAESMRARAAGELFETNARKVRGMEKLLPLNTAEWPREARFTGGCRKCGESIFALGDLMEDADQARATRAAVNRTIPHPKPVT